MKEQTAPTIRSEIVALCCRSRAVVLALALLPVAAFSQEGKLPWEEYDKLIKTAGVVSTHGPTLFGDSVSLYNGALSFSATDVEVSGNGNLPMAVRRSYSIGNRKGKIEDQAFADWTLDTPRLSGVFAPYWPDKRCSVSSLAEAQPPTVYGGNSHFSGQDYWQGNQAQMPGGGEMLLADQGAPMPGAVGPWHWMTSEFTYFSCLDRIREGSGEGFMAMTADGTRYWFDWMAKFQEADLIGRGEAWGMGYDLHFPRSTIVLYATRVEDRFGNWVEYDYINAWNEPGQLAGIRASDGRAVSLSYNARGHVSTVTDGARTWTYQYNYSDVKRPTLSGVVLPDGSGWSIDFADLTSAEIEYEKAQHSTDVVRSCASPGFVISASATGRITHPAGAVGSFTVTPKRHGRSNVPRVCSGFTWPNDPNDDIAYYPLNYDAFSLSNKYVTGPDLVPMTWQYTYASDISFASGTGPTCSTDDCAGSATTTVEGPEGEWVRHVFGNSYRYNEGKLLKVERGTGPDSILRSEVLSYELAQSGQAYKTPIGTSPQLRGDGFTSEYLRPQKGRRVEQEGQAYTTTLSEFDEFARPHYAYKSSSLGFDKGTTTHFHDDAALWVLGQVKSVTDKETGLQVSRTDYGYKALPVKTYSFGRPLDTLAYHTTAGSDGLLKSVADGNGNVTLLSSWYRGVPRSIRYADGATQSAAVNPDGTIASVTDENGFSTSYQYDTMGRMSRTDFPAGDTNAWAPITQGFAQIPSSEYGIPAGHWRQVVFQGDRQLYRYFDALWRPVLEQEFDVADKLGTRRVTARRYDHAGRETFVSYPGGVPANPSTFTDGTYSTYDVLGRKRSVGQTSAYGMLTTTLTYAANGGYLIATNPRNYVTRTWYQAFDEPTYDAPVKITRQGDVETHIDRDDFGKPRSLTQRNASGSEALTRQYAYLPNQLLCKTIAPEAGSTVYGYDAAGNLTRSAGGFNYPNPDICESTTPFSTDRRIDRLYDARNRLVAVRHSDGRGDLEYTYTPDGLVASVEVDNDGVNTVKTSYSYNRRRLPTEELTRFGTMDWYIRHYYDANGNLASQGFPGGVGFPYAPNALGQPTRAGGYAYGASYYPNGALRQFTYGNGIVHTLTQNARGLPERSRDAYGTTAVHDDSYDYDFNGNVAAISDGLPGAPGNRTMAYDQLDRLTGVTAPMFGGDGQAAFTYDALDNLLTARVGSQSNVRYVYDANNRLTNVLNSAGATITGLAYDPQGNVSDKNGQIFDFDFGNRLRSVTNGAQVSAYVYDGLGRRVRDFTAGSKHSLYSKAGQLVFDSDVRKKKQHWYVYLGGSMVATRERDATTGLDSITYQHTDALGSPVAVTDSARNVVERNRYAPYGALIGKPNPDGPGYTGHVMDAATGLTYMQQRYYDPSVGRFLSVDPVTANSTDGSNFNRYWYANNNPYAFTDPDGRQSVKVTTAIPEKELSRVDRAAISAGNRGQLLYEKAVEKSGNQAAMDSYKSTKVEYRRELSPAAQSIQDVKGQGSEGIRAYREPGEAAISVLPSFAELADSSMTFPDYHGMALGQGGDATLFLVIGHEHGHVLDMGNTQPHDREAAASDHSNQMKDHAPREIKRELRSR
ncbi:RHS repeat domain-containing protein [Lysobacter sp. A3-1-A15]|uniref:RHS repeat domain-containing protein n=1 Tax=Novilysobacter viscosus TaxID=3098602 RepID=UPI002ED86E7A